MVAKTKTFAEAFWPRVNKTDGCWLWVGGSDSSGYGKFSASMRAHQASYAEFVGPLERGKFVCHKCDIPRCVNPDHLFLGTAGDNNRDRNRKGRTSKASRNVGSGHGMAKLSEPDVAKIRFFRKAGLKLKIVSRIFGISEANVSLIARRKAWAHASGG